MKLNRLSMLAVILALTCSVVLSTGAAVAAEEKEPKAKPAKKPAHSVAVMYFHRTKRCDTCKKISAYIEEAIKTGMADEVKAGKVKVHMIDFQKKKNEKLTKAYKIKGPTLIVADVHEGKVKQWKPMPKVWSLVFEKEKFFEYVQGAVKDYLKEK